MVGTNLVDKDMIAGSWRKKRVRNKDAYELDKRNLNTIECESLVAY